MGIYIYSILNKFTYTKRIASSSSSFSPLLPPLPPANSSYAFCYLYNLYINHLHDLCAYTCCHRRRINKLNKRKCSYVCNYAIHSLPQRHTTSTPIKIPVIPRVLHSVCISRCVCHAKRRKFAPYYPPLLIHKQPFGGINFGFIGGSHLSRSGNIFESTRYFSYTSRLIFRLSFFEFDNSIN